MSTAVICAHGAQISFGDLAPYLTYGPPPPHPFLELDSVKDDVNGISSISDVVIVLLHNLPETPADLDKRSVIAVGKCEDRQIQNCHKLAGKKHRVSFIQNGVKLLGCAICKKHYVFRMYKEAEVYNKVCGSGSGNTVPVWTRSGSDLKQAIFCIFVYGTYTHNKSNSVNPGR
jgi:hypothetical protein